MVLEKRLEINEVSQPFQSLPADGFRPLKSLSQSISWIDPNGFNALLMQAEHRHTARNAASDDSNTHGRFCRLETANQQVRVQFRRKSPEIGKLVGIAMWGISARQIPSSAREKSCFRFHQYP